MQVNPFRINRQERAAPPRRCSSRAHSIRCSSTHTEALQLGKRSGAIASVEQSPLSPRARVRVSERERWGRSAAASRRPTAVRCRSMLDGVVTQCMWWLPRVTNRHVCAYAVQTTTDVHVQATAHKGKKRSSPRDQQPPAAAALTQQLSPYASAALVNRKQQFAARGRRCCDQDDPRPVPARRCAEPTRVASSPAIRTRQLHLPSLKTDCRATPHMRIVCALGDTELSRRYRSLPCVVQESQHQQPLLSAHLRSQSLGSGR